MGPEGHEEAVVRLQHQGLWRRRRRSGVPERSRPARGGVPLVQHDQNRSKQGTSYNFDNDRKERTLDVSDLSAFPRGRAITFASGAPGSTASDRALGARPARGGSESLLRRTRPRQELGAAVPLVMRARWGGRGESVALGLVGSKDS
jgi:hypothetical protein